MSKKILLIILCTFLITGCDVKYDLEITNDSYDENVTFSLSKNDDNYDYVENYKNSKMTLADSNKNYEIDYKKNDYGYDISYHYKHDINTFKDSSFINRCYYDFNVKNTDKEIILSTGKYFACIDNETVDIVDDGLKADGVQINITTKLKVLKNNADSVYNNTYVWNINKKNYKNKPIKMTLEKSIELEDIESSATFMTFVIVIFIVIIGGIIYFVIKRKNEKNNNF